MSKFLLQLIIDDNKSGFDEVSSKYSFLGAAHTFSVYEGGTLVDYTVEIGLAMMIGIGFNIYRDGEPLMESLGGSKISYSKKQTSEFV